MGREPSRDNRSAPEESAARESPSEQTARSQREALKTNPERSGRKSEQDIDRIFGRRADYLSGPSGWYANAKEFFRSSATRQGESLAPSYGGMPVRLALLQGDTAVQDLAQLDRLSGRGQRCLSDVDSPPGSRPEPRREQATRIL